MAQNQTLSIQGEKEIISTWDALKQLAEQLIIVRDQMKQVSLQSSIFSGDILSAGQAVMSAYDKFTELKDSLPKLKEKITQVFQSDMIKSFENVVTNACKSTGNSITNYKTIFEDSGNAIAAFPAKVKDGFGKAVQNISDFTGNAKESFGNFKDSLKNINFDTIKQGIKGLPKTLDEGIQSMGEKLSSSASSIGSAAGKLLSTGMIAGVAVIVVALATLITSFQYLMETNESFRTQVEEAWAKVSEAFQPAIDAFNVLKEALFGAPEEDGFTPFVQLILDSVTGLIDFLATGVGYIAEILANVFSFLTELWEEDGVSFIDMFREGWQGISDFLSDLFGFIGEIFSQLFSTFTEFWEENGETIKTTASEIWDKVYGAVSTVWESIKGVISTVLEIVMQIWEEYGDDIMNTVLTIWNFVSSIFSGAVNVVSGILDIVVGIFTGNGEKIKEGFGKVWEGIKEIFSGIGEFFAGIWDSIVSVFKKVGTKIGDAVSGAFKTVVNGVIGFVEKIVNGVIRGINTAIKCINLIPGVDIDLIAKVSFKRMETGGLVEPGQFFLAREAGPELVGTIGSHTAVMNNDMIVEAVSNGVYKAVNAAMSNSRADQPLNITLKVNETQLGKVAVNAINSLSRTQGRVNLAF